MTEPTRIVLVGQGLPRILRDLVREIIHSEPDMEIVEELAEMDVVDTAEVVSKVLHARAHLLLVGTPDSQLADTCTRLLDDYPKLRVLGISTEGRSGFVSELRPDGVSVGELSPRALIAAIRGSSVA
jgi:DNA-binding NarL/FixJ family response regulator